MSNDVNVVLVQTNKHPTEQIMERQLTLVGIGALFRLFWLDICSFHFPGRSIFPKGHLCYAVGCSR